MEFMNYSTSYTNNTFVFFADTKAKVKKTKRAVFSQRSKKSDWNYGVGDYSTVKIVINFRKHQYNTRNNKVFRRWMRNVLKHIISTILETNKINQWTKS